ncbi:hypothetical protein ACIP01_11010 [Pseudomonas monteilii]|uniref:hypothetical protein n=1 Tax=Pseudomonas monteilii TaxID=76759 RepID=UPI0037F119D9
MIRNFTIHDGTDLKIDHQTFEIFNVFKIRSIDFDFELKTLTITLSGIKEYLSPPPVIRLCFQSIARLYTSGNFFQFNEAAIYRFGFKRPDDTDLDWIHGEKDAEPDDDFIVMFYGDEHFRIHCATITAHVNYERN